MSAPVDATLIAELFDRYAPTLELFARQHAATAAADCVQEAFCELARLATSPPRPAAWLFRVVRHRALNAARSAQRRSRHEQHAAERRQVRRPCPDPSDEVALIDLLHQLVPERRELVVLRIWGQLTFEEIAEVTSRSRSAVQREYVDALTQLRRLLEADECPTNTSNDLR